MPTPLNDGPAGNTYNLIAALNTRLGDSIRAAALWESVDPDDQIRSAISATLLMDQVRYEGTPTSQPPTQTRAFPRDGLTDRYGTALAANTTPEDVRQAHALLTFEVSQDPELEAQISSAATAVRRVRAGSVEVENFAPGAFLPITRFPPRIQDLLAPFLAGFGAATSEGAAEDFGTCDCSQFDDDDQFSLLGGLP
jgi:hypothetical protein